MGGFRAATDAISRARNILCCRGGRISRSTARSIEDLARRQQAAQHRLSAQGELRPALGLRARSLGTTLLRELAIKPEVAAAQVLREVRSHDRTPLGRHRCLLPA